MTPWRRRDLRPQDGIFTIPDRIIQFGLAGLVWLVFLCPLWLPLLLVAIL
jgi:hypothetical protein